VFKGEGMLEPTPDNLRRFMQRLLHEVSSLQPPPPKPQLVCLNSQRSVGALDRYMIVQLSVVKHQAFVVQLLLTL
jgi:hypothetical protein